MLVYTRAKFTRNEFTKSQCNRKFQCNLVQWRRHFAKCNSVNQIQNRDEFLIGITKGNH